jgi:hypothetical protein
MLTELVGSQEYHYVTEVMDLYIQSESFMLSGLRH